MAPPQTSRTLNIPYLQSGTYTVTLEACNIAGCQTTTIPVTLEGVLFVDFQWKNAHPEPPKVLPGTPILFQSLTTGVSYEWEFDTISVTQGTGTPVYNFPNPGIYEVTLTVTTADGCERSTTEIVEVTDVNGAINVPPNNADLLLQPNPTQDRVQLNYSFTGKQEVRLQVTDVVGKTLQAQRVRKCGGQLPNHARL